jgi:MEMO1 family protein
MLEIRERDAQRIGRINAGDVRAYWELVQEKHDDLKWCGASPVYTFLKVMPHARGELLNYHQWQIDPHSVVTFGALRFQDSND